MEERINKTVAKINELIDKGKFDIYGQEYEDLISQYGANELMVLGCKMCKTPTGIKHIEIPYHGISKRRLNKAFETLEALKKD